MTLEKLASDRNDSVRISVARNSNTPVNILEKLATDDNHSVRISIARNKNTPVSVLEKLLRNDEEHNDVRCVASCRLN